VRKLNHDLAAVKNALRESWSNGPVEGHINRKLGEARSNEGKQAGGRPAELVNWLAQTPRLVPAFDNSPNADFHLIGNE
jgi:hypothetical protein